MRETLFLNKTGCPAGFASSQSASEDSIVRSMNRHGRHRSVMTIRYLDLRSCFKHFERVNSKFVGAICTSVDGPFDPDICDPYTWQEQVDGNCVTHTIKAFVVLTPSEIRSRNSFIAQTLFPFLFTQITTTSDTACKIVSAKPIYLICMLPDGIEIPHSVQRDINFVSSAGIRVIAPFRSRSLMSDRPLTVEEMDAEQSRIGPSRHKMFSVNEGEKTFVVEKSGLYELLNDEGRIQGSNEKFGMLSLLTAVVVARRSGFSIDMSSFNEWISDLGSKSLRTKYQNMENVRQFLMKIAR